MASLKAMISRNIKCYLRAKSNIFYSLMSVIIIVGLYLLFMSRSYTEQMEQQFANFPVKNIQWLSDSIMLSGLIPIISITVSLVALALMVEDKEKKISLDFMVAPINRNMWMISYLITSIIICGVASAGMIILSDMYLFAISGYALTFLQIVKIIGITILGLIFGNVFLLFLISFAKTQNAVGGLGTIIGTMIGFVSGCYLPLDMFPKGIQYGLFCMPFAQMTSLIRNAYLESAPKVMNLPQGGEHAIDAIKEFYGVNIAFGDWQVPAYLLVISVLAFSIVFGTIAAFRFIKLKNK